MMKEEKILNSYLKSRGMRKSRQRTLILRLFLNIEKHITADGLYAISCAKDSSIGRATVYRTMKILSSCGLAREITFADGIKRYEHSYRHRRHDHLVCRSCNSFFEVADEKIDKLQKLLAGKKGFVPESRYLTIYGTCRKCAE